MEKQKEDLEVKEVEIISPTEDVQNEAELKEDKVIETESESPELISEVVDESAEKVEAEKPESKEQVDEHDSEGEESEEEQIDFDLFDKKQLVDFIVSLKAEDDMRKVDRMLKQLKPKFDEIYHEQRQNALDQFLAVEGNTEEDFEYRGEELDERFNDYYGLLKDRRNQYFRDLENQKESNLQKKLDILDKIRDLVDGEESTISLKAIRTLQDDWKAIGPVPANQNRTLWANYHALLDRFYDARSIYFELKELDRKKNYDQKLELCEKAEALASQENVKEAVNTLNELHEEYKHIGPVPADLQEELWQRFKAASDAIYAKRKDFVDELKKELFANLDKKQALVEKIREYTAFASDRISEWNTKTKEILAIQKEWESIGGLPKEKSRQVNKAFWSSFKDFFNSKSQFFKELESKHEENLEKKKSLIERAEALKVNQEWDKTANEFKKLQQEWKDIGPVSDKLKNEVYNQFKAACDFFFDQKRNQTKQAEQAYEENYKLKLAICDKLDVIAKSDKIDLEAVYDLIDEFLELGFVPRKAIKKMNMRFDEVTAKLISSKGLNDDEKQDLKIQLQVSRLRGGPNGNKKVNRKEQVIKRRIDSLSSDINTYKTNIEFFASSKTADKLKLEMNAKIEEASVELDQLKKQLRLLKEA